MKSIRDRYLAALENIALAAGRAGQDPRRIRLVVVTKSQPLEIVQAVIDAGVRLLGENYPEEGVTKIQSLRDCSAVEWHMIGHVQGRKAQLVAQNFHYLHSLDSVKLANRLDRFCGQAGRPLPTLLEFNVGGEQSKSGWPAWEESRWPDLTPEMASVLALPNLSIRGLMAMPPIGADAEYSRPFFQKVKRLQEYLHSQFPQADFSEISMGTSIDYEVAVEEGATLVRVGTSIVGPRRYATEVE